ncbi:MAG: hypothetical protein V7776_13440 [Halopseudomonas aestusnigri]
MGNKPHAWFLSVSRPRAAAALPNCLDLYKLPAPLRRHRPTDTIRGCAATPGDRAACWQRVPLPGAQVALACRGAVRSMAGWDRVQPAWRPLLVSICPIGDI